MTTPKPIPFCKRAKWHRDTDLYEWRGVSNWWSSPEGPTWDDRNRWFLGRDLNQGPLVYTRPAMRAKSLRRIPPVRVGRKPKEQP